MARRRVSKQLFSKYFEDWVEIYKVGAVRDITLQKYYITLQWLEELAPDLEMGQLDRRSYQKLLNDYAITHEKQTTMDFHHQIKGALLDAVDEGVISRNPARNVIIKGKKPREKKTK